MDALAQSRRVNYKGAAGLYKLNGDGEPTTGSFAVETFGADNMPDADGAAYVQATAG
jgi:hypothetical protein